MPRSVLSITNRPGSRDAWDLARRLEAAAKVLEGEGENHDDAVDLLYEFVHKLR